MELELGLKLGRVADEFSSADFQIMKDRSGPLFLSRESDSMFILTAHLRGYRKSNIKIEINEDGTRIVISGEKAVQETVMVGWRLQKKETEIRRFRKAFKIPDGVILDKIRAKFDDEESVLTVSMPKKEKGIRGVNVEEVKEPELVRGNSETLRIDDHEFPREKITNQDAEDRYTEEDEAAGGKSPEVPETVSGKEPEKTRVESTGKAAPMGESTDGLEGEIHLAKPETEEISQGQTTDKDHGKENDTKPNEKQGEEEEAALLKPPEMAVAEEGGMEEKGRFKVCTSLVAGSALIFSIVAFVIHFIRTKSQPGKKRD